MGAPTDLERGDVRVRDVAVHVLDLRQVLLRHVHQLRRSHLVGQAGKAVVLGGRVFILVPVLLEGAGGEGRRANQKDC